MAKTKGPKTTAISREARGETQAVAIDFINTLLDDPAGFNQVVVEFTQHTGGHHGIAEDDIASYYHIVRLESQEFSNTTLMFVIDKANEYGGRVSIDSKRTGDKGCALIIWLPSVKDVPVTSD